MTRWKPARWTLAAVVAASVAILAPGLVTGQAPQPDGFDPDCSVCRLWERYEESLAQARREVAALEGGAAFFLSSDNFRVIEQLQRFAYERQGLEESGAARRHPKSGVHGPEGNAEVHLEIATSIHGVFAIITTDDPETARRLREEASYAVRRDTVIRF